VNAPEEGRDHPTCRPRNTFCHEERASGRRVQKALPKRKGISTDRKEEKGLPLGGRDFSKNKGRGGVFPSFRNTYPARGKNMKRGRSAKRDERTVASLWSPKRGTRGDLLRPKRSLGKRRGKGQGADEKGRKVLAATGGPGRKGGPSLAKGGKKEKRRGDARAGEKKGTSERKEKSWRLDRRAKEGVSSCRVMSRRGRGRFPLGMKEKDRLPKGETYMSAWPREKKIAFTFSSGCCRRKNFTYKVLQKKGRMS